MHHPDPAEDSSGVRKMAHPPVFQRRGSNTGSSGTALSTPANSVVTNSHVSAEDYQASLLIQCQTSAGSSSPGPHHPSSPHSLNLHSQPTQSAGAQVKKKSGFQITSVTPAQLSVSTNNSIAEDTESYDDLDESHTEDLSSSEIMDVSLSRANDIVGAERSSSEETLNNFHEAETPGVLSPNQPPHPLNQTSHHGGGMVNGTGPHHHHHHHHHHPHHHNSNNAQSYALSSGPVSTPPVLATSATQKMPSNMAVTQETAPPSVQSQPAGVAAPGSVPGMPSSATGTSASILNSQTSSVSNVNMLSSAKVPVRGEANMSTSSSSGGFSANMISSGGSAVAAAGNFMTTSNVAISQQHQNIPSNITMTTTTTAAVNNSGGSGVSRGSQGKLGSAVQQPVTAAVTAAPATAVRSTAAPAASTTAAATSSRFRVVKLDSSSEPFKKGRWTCTDFYDKEPPVSAPGSSTSEPASNGLRQIVSEGFAGGSERESTSGSSVSSTMSTLGHYMESVSNVESGGAPPLQQAQDYSSPPQGFQAILPGGLSMTLSQNQPHMDMNHCHIKTTVAPSSSATIHQSAAMPGLQTAMGLPMTAVPQQQQLTYAQAVANQTSQQGLVGVQQHKVTYPSMPQQSTTMQAAPVQVRPSEYNQPHQLISQPPAAQPLLNQTGSAASGPPNGAPQMLAGPQPTQPHVRTQPQQSVHVQPTNVGLPGHQQSHPTHLDCQQQKPQSFPTQIPNPGLATQNPTTIPQTQVSATSVPLINTQIDSHSHMQAQNAGYTSGIVPQGAALSLTQDQSSAQAIAHAAQASALYASLPTFTTTQLQDAQRLLLQHQSALLGLPKLSVGDPGSGSGTCQGQDVDGNATSASALTASAGLKSAEGEEDGSSGASVVAIDNKIEQAMDLVKSHLMYAVREEVEVLKEQIKELIERNTQLEQENTLLKTLASPEQMAQFQAQVQTGSPPTAPIAVGQATSHNSGPPA
ncbi:TSC22 domain family protein 1 isoform 1-T1 [Synchiropus picturatus]